MQALGCPLTPQTPGQDERIRFHVGREGLWGFWGHFNKTTSMIWTAVQGQWGESEGT